jgi:hypothetical protein
MVLPYYQLREQPFGVTPDSRYFYLSNTHREALASLLYGVDAGCGFLAVIAAPGLGKTTLLFDALRCLRQAALTVFLFGTVCTPLELLRSLLTALGVKDAHGNLTRLQSRLQDVLIEQARLGKRVVVVMDEAQNLDPAVLELIRMLSNFETPQHKLLQINSCRAASSGRKDSLPRPPATAPADLDLRPSETILSGRDAALHRAQVESSGLHPQGIRLSNAPVVRLGLVLSLSDERSVISTKASESGRGGEAGCGARSQRLDAGCVLPAAGLVCSDLG